jgi:hypothetical protein
MGDRGGMNMPWKESEYSQETVWRDFCKAHEEVGRKDCELSRFVQDVLDGRIANDESSRIGIYR